ncbi:MAG: globin [Acidobacteriaceae bacterium]|nr:globin [Acidobacteriaceae bacterium]
MREDEVYAQVGEEGFRRLVAAFYRQVPRDDVLGHIYPKDDLAGAEERLRDFLIFRFGGPERYVERRGHPRLRMRHAPFAVDQAARDRWMQLMRRALEEAEFPEEARSLLLAYFEATATAMMNRVQ